MKVLIFIACLLLKITFAANAQQTVTFSYDPAGNRVLRNISVFKMSEADSTLSGADISQQNENLTAQKIAVYPNPTDGLVNIELSLPVEGKCIYTLTSVNGAVIEQGIITSTHTPLNLQHLSKGTYLLRVETSQLKEKFKIVKQ